MHRASRQTDRYQSCLCCYWYVVWKFVMLGASRADIRI